MIEKPLIKITNEDNMKLMARYKDKHFDLAIVDPPYGLGADKMNMGTNLNRKDGWKRDVSTAVKVRNRLKGGGHFKNSKMNTMDVSWDTKPDPEYFKEVMRVSKNQIIWGGNYFPLPPTRCIICWDKKQPWDNFSQWEMAWT